MTDQVINDIKSFINAIKIDTPVMYGDECPACKEGASDDCESGCHLMQLTVATNDDGDVWNYQTGDNSYTGGCYSLPHWAVVWLDDDDSRNAAFDDVINQLSDLRA